MSAADKPILVFQSDFTYAEGAVSSMYGVVKSVDRELEIFDGTHYIPKFDTWSASYRLYQSLPFWPEGTIYVSVVDPGVGTSRRACVARTASGHLVVTPDNGTLTHLARYVGIDEVREIDERANRLRSTLGTSVFAGRDVFGYTAARLASGAISWDEVGPSYPVSEVVVHDFAEPTLRDGAAAGIVEIVDPNFGNAWTNVPVALLARLGIEYGDAIHVEVSRREARRETCGGEVRREARRDESGGEPRRDESGGEPRREVSRGEVHDRCGLVFSADVPFERSFGMVDVGEAVVYTNEVMNVAFALNQGSFIERTGVGFGPDWTVTLSKA
ncbi:MAG: SAM-dependent chlorinase/fluorinase [Atopobiaceae bacterium]|nr:SAM-dependent chlorinase/fluorinase [Atopobiaceae bacterium]